MVEDLNKKYTDEYELKSAKAAAKNEVHPLDANFNAHSNIKKAIIEGPLFQVMEAEKTGQLKKSPEKEVGQ